MRAGARLAPLLALATGSAALAAEDQATSTCIKITTGGAAQIECPAGAPARAQKLTLQLDAAICKEPTASVSLGQEIQGRSIALECPVEAGTPWKFRCASPVTFEVAKLEGTFTCGTAAPIKIAFRDEGAKDSGGSGGGGGGGDEPSVPLAALPESAWKEALGAIPVPLEGARYGNYYNRREDVAVLFFNSAGVPFFPIPDVIDEDDDIYVVVIDHEAFLKDVPITISGCNRPQLQARVAGQSIPVVTSEPGKGAAPPPKLGRIIRPFGKCAGAASGGPQVTIEAQATTIPVNPLYQFAVGAALAYDNTQARTYELRTLPGEGIARIARSDDRLGLSSLLYISFYPFARDFRKKDFFLGQRAQVFVGLDPRALDKHLVAGLGYELTVGLNALVGWRLLTKQPVLAEGSGLHVGDMFDGTKGTLPTRERWEIGSVFLGVGLSSDLLTRLR